MQVKQIFDFPLSNVMVSERADEKENGVDNPSLHEPQQANCYDKDLKTSWIIWRFMTCIEKILKNEELWRN